MTPQTPTPGQPLSEADVSLLPCPFCGSVDHLSVGRTGSAVGGYYPHNVRCRHLDCDEVEGPTGNGRFEAIAAWNRRAPAPVSRPAGEDWHSLSCDEQFKLATKVAANVGYVLTPEPDHPDCPHASRPAGEGEREAVARLERLCAGWSSVESAERASAVALVRIADVLRIISLLRPAAPDAGDEV